MLGPRGNCDLHRQCVLLADPDDGRAEWGTGSAYQSWGQPAEWGAAGLRPTPETALHFPLGPLHWGQRASSGSRMLASLLEALQSRLRGWGCGRRPLSGKAGGQLCCIVLAAQTMMGWQLTHSGHQDEWSTGGLLGALCRLAEHLAHALSQDPSATQSRLGGESAPTAPAALPAPDLICTLPEPVPFFPGPRRLSSSRSPAGHVASVRKASVEQSSHPGTHYHHPPTRHCYKAKPW